MLDSILKKLSRRTGTEFSAAPVAESEKTPITPRSEFDRLNAKYGKFPRYTPLRVTVLNYDLDVVDCASFLAQFKEIFVEEIYRFKTESKAPTIIDCGANIGVSCLYFKHLYPDCRITAFEADPQVCEVLRKNIDRNGLTGVEIVAKAVWTSDAGVSFSLEGADGGSVHGTGEKVLVPSVRLRDVLSAGAGKTTFLKMDIEGAECDVVEDCAEAIEGIPFVFIEYHSWTRENQRLDELLSRLRSYGFRYYISPVITRFSPFINTGVNLPMDLQLNIFAHKD